MCKFTRKGGPGRHRLKKKGGAAPGINPVETQGFPCVERILQESIALADNCRVVASAMQSRLTYTIPLHPGGEAGGVGLLMGIDGCLWEQALSARGLVPMIRPQDLVLLVERVAWGI